jgi:hypothetical protein
MNVLGGAPRLKGLTVLDTPTIPNKTSMPTTPAVITSAAAAYLERLATELDVAPSRYEEAKRRYKSVGEWLGRDESTLKEFSPEVYVQGSFRLGTPIRPVSTSEHYDIDLVCELSITKRQMSQQQLKELLGYEMRLYAKAHGMKEIGEGRRCWTLEYADGAQFHLDALPAIPDAEGQRRQLTARHLSSSWTDTAIAITDLEHPLFRVVHEDWPHSNPKGYTNWFRSRMKASFEALRGAMALEAKASVESIPSYRVKTPLQQATQILKRHRDLMFQDDPTHKPISVIIATLAGLSYNNEPTVALALAAILKGMDAHIKYDAAGKAVIANPTDPSENFADRWRKHPERRKNFFEWLAKARTDFAELAKQVATQRLVEVAGRSVGDSFARNAATGSKRPVSFASLFPRAASALAATHKQPAPWLEVRQGQVEIAEATWTGRGFSRPMRFKNDSPPLRKNASLTFRARTDIPAPFDVYWQVVNSGAEAAQANGLRGGFDVGSVDRGAIVRREGTEYAGAHTIECFIVKDRHLVARSGPFIVNIA